MASLMITPKIQFLDNNGDPLVGGKLYTYQAGTNTNLTTWTTEAQSVQNTNPIILDSRGEANVFLSGTYKFVLTRSNDTEVWTVDNISHTNQIAAALVTYLPSSAGAQLSNVQRKFDEAQFISLADFVSGSIPTDITTYLQAAIAARVCVLTLPQGSYTYSSPLTIDHQIIFRGTGSCAAGTYVERSGGGGATGNPGEGTTLLTYTGTTGSALTIVGSGTEGIENVHFHDFSLWGNVNCDNGLVIGTGTVVSKSSFKNISIKNFKNTGTDKGAGVLIKNCILTDFENVYCHANRDGWNIYGIATTLNINQCYGRVNLRYGALIQQLTGADLTKLVCEGNAAGGLAFNARNGQSITAMSLYQYYSEANCDSISGPAVSFETTGTGVIIDVVFYRPNIYELLTGNVTRLVKFMKCDSVKFLEVVFTSMSNGFIECTSDTSKCVISGRSGDYTPHSYVVGNGYDSDGERRVLLTNGDPRTGLWTPSIAAGGTASSFDTCRFIRDGNKVDVFGMANITDITGTIKIGPLPFTPDKSSGFGSASKVSTVTIDAVIASTDGYLYLYPSALYSSSAQSCYFGATYYI